ncbi:MAG: hypothetical protein ACRD4X_13665 [Candidatus Acidiferrales bacterium]
MPSKRGTKTLPPFLLNEVDRLGRPIAPDVLSVARQIGPRAVAYAESLIGDAAVAVTCLEEAAASVAAAIQEKQRTGAPAVRDIGAYLFRTFIHMIDKAKQREMSFAEAVEEYGERQFTPTEEGRAETAVLINEIMAACDQVSREIVLLRLRDRSWDEIGKHFGISPYAAETRYRKALDRARKTLKIQK